MKLITPTVITDAMLVSSSLTEADFPAWAAATAYTAGTKVIRTTTHSIYQRLVSGTTATPPESDSVNWVRVGPTNRWAMFDQVTGTASKGTTSFNFVLAPGMVRAIALLDVVANQVTVTVKDGATTVYTQVVNMNSGYGVSAWDGYFFNDIVRRTTVVLTDLPPYANGQITVTIDGVGAIEVGTVAVGQYLDMGDTKYGMSLGIIDYSVKSTDAYGATSVVQRPYAKRMSVPVWVASVDVDEVARRLSLLRATPVVWVGSELYDQSVVFGFYKDWSIDIAYPTVSQCTLTIEGLS